MSRGLLFWILMILWFLAKAGAVAVTVQPQHAVYVHSGFSILEFILFLLLGWAVYGPPLKA